MLFIAYLKLKKRIFYGCDGFRLTYEAKGSGIKLTANTNSLADALFRGANVSLAESLFGLAVSV